MSTPNSPFRHVFADRIACLGEEAEFGSFGRMVRLLQEVWRQSGYVGERTERSLAGRDAAEGLGLPVDMIERS